jgi:predicted transposase/invertase (TIGR01784 family)
MTTKKKSSPEKDNLPDILPPKSDVVFKMLFGDEENKETLIAFLEAVLSKKINEVNIIDPINKKRSKDDKLSILDVKAEFESGEIIVIEMQAKRIVEMRERITFCSSRATVDQLKSGKKYSDIKPVISIIVMGETLIHESQKCHNVFLILEKDEHFPFNNLQEIHVLDLSRIKREKDKTLSDWLSFINSEEKEDFMAIAKRNPAINKAFEGLQKISSNGRQRRLYLARLIQQTDILVGEDAARQEGIGQGRQEGMQVVLEYLAKGYSIEEAKKKFLV